ncbi:flagellar biosynthetic protein FliO [Neorhizobium sp. JUb45]|uniref:flagellar biosynthetic protein FliO n=1 Tax=unclassified Neorhizobium TaxID=2629175 RepID=UPI001052B72A|nr:flagellar biosynthetic protein FliO [Neorhizobium sp. JUb45]TCR05038.1 flagellar biosynthesis protein FliO [Neorhizobium sp. JUb45]
MLDEMLGAYGSNLTIAVVGVAAGFLCLILVLWLIRGRGGPSPFLRGGKNRQPRLQVLDAAAVDARRRLVLVRRDDVEHLIMIGGPTDIVIESSIVDGRSPPYHTLMKTVSEPEQPALVADEPPRVPEPAARAAGLSAPAPRAAPVTATPEKPAAVVEEKEKFAWLSAEPVDIAPVAKVSEPVRSTAPAEPPARNPETPKFSETPPAPVQPAPLAVPAEPNVSEITPQAEQRSPETPRPVDPAPVIEFPSAEPRSEVAAPASPTPMTTAFATAAPAAAPMVASPSRFQSEPAPSVSIDETPKAAEPHFEIVASRPTSEPTTIDNAADLLDAARERVFQQPRAEAVPAPAQRPTPPVVQMPVTPARQPAPATATAAAPAKPLGSDFERILEEEMASNLASGNAAPAVGPAVQNAPGQLPRRDPSLARVTGATQEPALQNEIARIFGEMSVTKDDR